MEVLEIQDMGGKRGGEEWEQGSWRWGRERACEEVIKRPLQIVQSKKNIGSAFR